MSNSTDTQKHGSNGSVGSLDTKERATAGGEGGTVIQNHAVVEETTRSSPPEASTSFPVPASPRHEASKASASSSLSPSTSASKFTPSKRSSSSGSMIRSLPRLSKPFKSPLIKKSQGEASTSSTNVTTPSKNSQSIEITRLEARLRLLKQAYKYDSEETLQTLSEIQINWRDAARRATEELWEKVGSEMDPKNMDDFGAWDNSWGYAEESNTGGRESKEDRVQESKNLEGFKRANEVEVTPDDGQEEEDGRNADEVENEKEWNMGEMLAMFGVNKELLGWSSAELDWED